MILLIQASAEMKNDWYRLSDADRIVHEIILGRDPRELFVKRIEGVNIDIQNAFQKA